MLTCDQLKQIQNRKISIITNFGCRADCWYCIWKDHKLKNCGVSYRSTDWEKLEEFLSKYRYKGKVSLSGGGDCLYKYNMKPGLLTDWWTNFIHLINKYNLGLDIHTREKFLYFPFFEDNINRVVFSSDNLYQPNLNISTMSDAEYLEQLRNYCQVRIVHLVTKNTSLKMIEDYLNFTKEHNMQFTIKKLVGFDDGGMYDLIKQKYPDVFYLDEGDYNIYYMPDNKVYDKFLI